MNINNLELSKIILHIFTIMYIFILVIIAGIDKKHLKIEKRAVSSGIILSVLYIMYLYKIDSSRTLFNIMYLGAYVILLVADNYIIKIHAQNSYTLGILMLFNIIVIFSGIDIFIYTLIMTSLEILMYILVSKIKQKKNGNKKVKISDIPVGYLLGISNIFIFAIVSFMINCKLI